MSWATNRHLELITEFRPSPCSIIDIELLTEFVRWNSRNIQTPRTTLSFYLLAAVPIV
jgi:hypothetical protein